MSSDLPALLPIIGERGHLPVGFLEDGEAAVLTRQGVTFLDRAGRSVDKPLRPVSLNDVLVDRAGYRHFMLKEIMEQPQAVVSAMRDRVDFAAGRVTLPELTLSDAELAGLRRVVLIGCGTSLNAALGGTSSHRASGRHPRRSRVRLRVPLPGALPGRPNPRRRHRSVRGNRRHRGRHGAECGQPAADALACLPICNAPDSQAVRLADLSPADAFPALRSA